MSDIKMSAIFGGEVCADKYNDWLVDASGESFAYFTAGDKQKCHYAAIAINSYDSNQALITKQAEQIKVLREALSKVCAVNHTHGGSLGVCGSFYYKVSEEVFKSCENALEATKD